jgi:uncharacterized protein YbjT (DUF2867 family)
MQAVAPVEVGDVAAVLAAADDREGIRPGTYGLEGPDRVTADELAVLAASIGRGGGRGIRDGRPRRRIPSDVPGEILASDSLADRPDAAAEFGVPRTPLAEGLARSLGARMSRERGGISRE